MNIVVVESPAKAKTINKYLGSGYEVLASFGHVRDLPAKDGSVDPEQNFRMIWEVDDKSQKRLNDIARALKGANKLILATDPDREGEAISWHVLEVLKEKHALKKQAVERVVFNAITKQAVLDAMKHPRNIDAALVDAYLARRALDYLVGFTLSPVLWRKLPGARSAGRVQSVALRLVCDRELEIEKFVPREYWSLVATLATPRGDEFEARLVGADGKKIQRLDIGSGAEAEAFKQALESAAFTVANVEAKPARRNPPPPFTTSTLQQEASRKLGFAPAHTMRIAQRLYEGVDIDGETVGLITYMRTDGVDIAEEALAAARRLIGADYGSRYLPASPRQYQTKAKNAQEAHEAIRPTDVGRRPRETKSFLDPDQAKLYELIWLRTMASQMESAELERTTADITAKAGGRTIDLRATGTVVKFDGFLTLYQEGEDDVADDEDCRRLPEMSAGERLAKRRIDANQHFTEPPPRYSEASLVKRMEELGIGRPSTYASILQVLKDRGYVRIDKRRLVPEDKGRVLTAFLESFFARYVEYDFTAGLEEQLDRISNNEIAWRDLLRDFWREFTAAVGDIKELRVAQVIDALDEMLAPHLFPPRADGSDPRKCPNCETGRLSLKLGKFGGFIGCTNYPECRYTRQLGAGQRRQRRSRRHEEARRGSGDRSRSDAALGPLRTLRAARRSGRRREAQARRPAEGRRGRRRRSRSRARAALAAARDRQASRRRRADHCRRRSLRALCPARQDLRQSHDRRRRAHRRAQPRGDADRGEAREGPAQGPFRRRSRPRARRSSRQGRPDRGEERSLRALCEPRRRQCHAAVRPDPGNGHARASRRAVGGEGRARRRQRAPPARRAAPRARRRANRRPAGRSRPPVRTRSRRARRKPPNNRSRKNPSRQLDSWSVVRRTQPERWRKHPGALKLIASELSSRNHFS